jgi:TonB family protein
MNAAATIGNFGGRKTGLAEESLYVLAGAGLTLVLFGAMAHFESSGAPATPANIEDLRAVSALYEPPPPKIEEQPQQKVDEVMPLTGIEIAPSDSAVRIAVVPPDLSKIIPTTDIPPKATIEISQLFTDLRPRSGLAEDFDRIFKPSEVDKAPVAVIKTIAHISHRVRENSDELRTTLELVIDAKGGVVNVHVIRSSGNPDFDSIVAQCALREWVFTPALRRGKSVKCLVDQVVWYKWSVGSPFRI